MKIIYECCIPTCNSILEVNDYIHDIQIVLPDDWARINFNKNGKLTYHYICKECVKTYFEIQ